jgi:uncharacterized protein with PIN domain/sulfur carrier protein ThiS
MAAAVQITFNGNLIELLPLKKRNQHLSVQWEGKRSVKDLIQSLEIPHTEIGKIQVNKKEVESSFILRGGEQVEVFPSPIPQPFTADAGKAPRFICDVHLRKLARRLRLLGFETWFDPRWEDEELADISQKEHLILLSRDRGLLKRNNVEQGLLIRNTDPGEQVKEVLRRLGIAAFINPFTRCLLCGHSLVRLAMEDELFQKKFKSQVPVNVLQWCSDYTYCPACQKIFWRGTHYKKLSHLIETYK